MLEGFKKSNINKKNIYITAEDCLEVLTDEEKEELINSSIEIEFKPGETIIKKGFSVNNIIFIENGLVKIDIDTDNQTSTIRLLSSKSFIGAVCSLSNSNFDFTAIALEKTNIKLFNIKLFNKFVHQNGEFACNLIKHISASNNDLIHHIARLANKNIYGALSIFLIDLSEIYKSDSFILPFKRKDMANILGYSKESVINTLSKLNIEGIIKVQEKNIEILDKKKLIQISERG